MSLHLHTLQAPPRLSNRKRHRVGRGDSSGHGSYSGRGQKGQSSRSGSGGLRLKGLRRRLMSIPKLGGFTSLNTKAQAVNVAELEAAFSAKAVVDPNTLKAMGLIYNNKGAVKILGKGDLTKSLTVAHCQVSESARKKIEAVGGTIA